MADSKKYDGSTWEHSLRKMTTATAEIEPTIYTDGTAITSYTIKGNTVQNGTPTPSAPIAVQGVGELETTGEHSGEYKIPISSVQTVNNYLGSIQSTRQIQKLVLTGNEGWTKAASATGVYYGNVLNNAFNQDLVLTTVCTHYLGQPNTSTVTLMEDMHCAVRSVQADTLYIRDTNIATREDWISYLQQQYANGTPVTVWYVLATAETAAVNEPLMKIGTYYDSISNAAAIPTTEGANSITVDTTVQPSEFTATWTGWHDSSVKEYDGSDWQ